MSLDSCLNRHFGGLSQLNKLPNPPSKSCLNRHFGGLSQHEAVEKYSESELLEPPFRRPFTTHRKMQVKPVNVA